jgi:lysozyme family protein
MAQYKFQPLRAEYERLWSVMKVVQVAAVDKQARQVIKARPIYEKIQDRTGVPWFVVGCLHMRESNGRFDTWLHNGDPMRRNGKPVQTYRVPAGRPPNPNVDFVEGAYDALVTVKGFDKITDWGPARVAYILESFNGFGYRHPTRNIPSPYLWGGTNLQKRGKFVADHVWDSDEWDTQIGGMAVLRRVIDLCPDARFWNKKSKPEQVEPPVQAEISPRAEDAGDAEVRPPVRSRTIWGGVLSYMSGLVGTGISFFGFLNNPYAFAAFALIMIAGAIGVYMVARGYIDVRKVVEHLSNEED